MPKNDRFLRALRRESVDCTPVWLMRQAGRYLPEYRATRAAAGSFLAMAKNPELACEVTLQPLRRFPLDAAILFSDILTVPDAMGLGLHFVDGEGPKFERTVRDEAAVAALAVPDLEKLRYVFDAVTSIRRALDGRVPLIGFSGSPWTLACYMVEGGGSTDFRQIKTLMYRRPDLLERILAVNAAAVAAYLNAQIEAGAQAVMIFDSWGGVLTTASDLVFVGTGSNIAGYFYAFDAKKGDLLWKFNTGAGVFSSPSTYMVNGEQFVIVGSGGGERGRRGGDLILSFALPREQFEGLPREVALHVAQVRREEVARLVGGGRVEVVAPAGVVEAERRS